MISFINKTVEAPIKLPGKKVKVKVVWKNNKFQGRIGKDVYDIDGWDDLSKCKYVYSLPTNTYYTPWHKRPYLPPEDNDKNILAMTLRFWGKYWQGMTLYGKIVDNIFYQNPIKHVESNIPKVTVE